jgi:hypothetical protein
MAKENSLWGAERIRGELLKLGIKVCKEPFKIHAEIGENSLFEPNMGYFHEKPCQGHMGL